MGRADDRRQGAVDLLRRQRRAHAHPQLVFNDPPLHTRVRRLITGALSARALAGMEEGVIALVDRLLDVAEERDEIDLIEDFGAAIPIEVIGNLLDIPHERRGPLRGESEPLIELTFVERAVSAPAADSRRLSVRWVGTLADAQRAGARLAASD